MYFHIVRYRQGLVGRHHREGVNLRCWCIKLCMKQSQLKTSSGGGILRSASGECQGCVNRHVTHASMESTAAGKQIVTSLGGRRNNIEKRVVNVLVALGH